MVRNLFTFKDGIVGFTCKVWTDVVCAWTGNNSNCYAEKNAFLCSAVANAYFLYIYTYIQNERKLRYNKDIYFYTTLWYFYYIVINVICPHSTLLFIINIISRIYLTYVAGVLNTFLLLNIFLFSEYVSSFYCLCQHHDPTLSTLVLDTLDLSVSVFCFPFDLFKGSWVIPSAWSIILGILFLDTFPFITLWTMSPECISF